VYGYPCERLTAEEGGAFGAALMAGVGAGHWRDLNAACAAGITVAETIQPNPTTRRRYAEGYAGFRRVYPALKGIRG
jgi:xylulokinase